MVVVFVIDYPVLQIQLMGLLCTLMMTYVAAIQPFKHRELNIMEIFNEFCILGCIYCLFGFTDVVTDSGVKYNLGWVAVAIVILNIIVNIVNMIIMTCRALIPKIKKKLENCGKKKAVKK